MASYGVGDRWLAGEKVTGVEFALHDPVTVESGRHAGGRGSIVLLVHVAPEPVYLVELANGGGEVRIRQSSLRPA